MASEKSSSKMDAVVKLGLVFFISLLSFSVGTYVGKKFSDSQYKLAQLEPTSSKDTHAANETDGVEEAFDRNIASVPHDAMEVKPNDPLSDEEIAKLAEEFVTDDTTAGKEKTEAHGSVAANENSHESAHGKPVENTTEKSKEPLVAAERLVKKEAPTAAVAEPVKAEKSRIPSSLPKEVATSNLGKYTVQVGSYKDEAEAKKIAEEMTAKKLNAFYVPGTANGATWYRVNIGSFNSKEEASKYEAALKSSGAISSGFVKKVE